MRFFLIVGKRDLENGKETCKGEQRTTHLSVQGVKIFGVFENFF